MAAIELEGVSKIYPNGFAAVDGINLTIDDGEFLALVGPSGCGKSTLLRMLAGLEEVTAGRVLIGGVDVTDFEPRPRDVAMVFQSYALYPHMSIRRNLGYGLRVRKTPKDEIERRVNEVAQLLGLEEMLDRRPSQLSGGQRQRVAMGRAIVREPKAFLMDEPLSNLDAKLRVGMRASLAQLHSRLGVTTVYVTHDQIEAMTLGQRVAVMRDGRFQQVDEPQRLYREPANLFVAAFIGSPSMNVTEAAIDDGVVRFGQFEVPLDRSRRPRTNESRIVLGLRPESFEDATFAATGLPTIVVQVEVVEELGSDTHVFFRVDAPQLGAEQLDTRDDEAALIVDDRALFAARVDPRTQARVGEPLRLAVDPARFHFFDVATGVSLAPGPVPAATAAVS